MESGDFEPSISPCSLLVLKMINSVINTAFIAAE